MKNRYLNQFFNSFCMASIAPTFDNYKKSSVRDKEITESMGCLNAAIKHSGFSPDDPDVKVIVVGDGVRPRTGIIFAYHTLWNVTSIDPLADIGWFSIFSNFRESCGHPIRRLEFLKLKVEDLPQQKYAEQQIIIMPHSHAGIVETLRIIQGKSTLISLPCCVRVDDRLKSETFMTSHDYRSYFDDQILSGKREINIWRNISYEDLPEKMRK